MNMAGTNYLEFEMQYASIALIWSNISGDQRFEYPPSFTSSATMHFSPTSCIFWQSLECWIKGCNTWYKIIGALSVLGRAAIIFSFTARAYAVWGRKRVVFVYLASVGIICVGLDIAHVPGLRCEGPSSIPM
ncbi:hypothetical protein C8R41DRAFT_616255 [Lentinula lateritia]|uniref:Uncharacterized protein n=1 Tax=Lentinula lateritia TaxID=40482 RepID=A0ABQ8V3A8_9AGAR|nr:hypothetical protein C8R41DRAFT_616255 [Lentinula lateritia]